VKGNKRTAYNAKYNAKYRANLKGQKEVANILMSQLALYTLAQMLMARGWTLDDIENRF